MPTEAEIATAAKTRGPWPLDYCRCVKCTLWVEHKRDRLEQLSELERFATMKREPGMFTPKDRAELAELCKMFFPKAE